MKRASWICAGVIAAGCGGGATYPEPESVKVAGDEPATAPLMAGPMTAAPAHRFVRGAALSPGSLLIAWLDQAGTLIVKLPVVLTHTLGGVADARISGESLPIELDTSGLGVALDDRLAGLGLAVDATGAVWLEGRWNGGTLIVSRVGDLIAPDALAGITHAELEAMP